MPRCRARTVESRASEAGLHLHIHALTISQGAGRRHQTSEHDSACRPMMGHSYRHSANDDAPRTTRRGMTHRERRAEGQRPRSTPKHVPVKKTFPAPRVFFRLGPVKKKLFPVKKKLRPVKEKLSNTHQSKKAFTSQKKSHALFEPLHFTFGDIYTFWNPWN